MPYREAGTNYWVLLEKEMPVFQSVQLRTLGFSGPQLGEVLQPSHKAEAVTVPPPG